MPALTSGTSLLIQTGFWLSTLGVTLYGWHVARRDYLRLLNWAHDAEPILRRFEADFMPTDDNPPTAPVEAVVARAVDRVIAEHPTTDLGPATMAAKAWTETEIERIRARSAERNARRPVVEERPWIDAGDSS